MRAVISIVEGKEVAEEEGEVEEVEDGDVSAAHQSEQGEVEFEEGRAEDADGLIHPSSLKPSSQLEIHIAMI